MEARTSEKPQDPEKTRPNDFELRGLLDKYAQEDSVPDEPEKTKIKHSAEDLATRFLDLDTVVELELPPYSSDHVGSETKWLTTGDIFSLIEAHDIIGGHESLLEAIRRLAPRKFPDESDVMRRALELGPSKGSIWRTYRNLLSADQHQDELEQMKKFKEEGGWDDHSDPEQTSRIEGSTFSDTIFRDKPNR